MSSTSDLTGDHQLLVELISCFTSAVHLQDPPADTELVEVGEPPAPPSAGAANGNGTAESNVKLIEEALQTLKALLMAADGCLKSAG